MNLQSLCLVVMLLGGTVISPNVGSAADDHVPSFTWQTRGGVVNAEQWIYDGDTPIALFENRTVEQPGEQLLFFNKVPRPLVLRKVKLTPDGIPLVDGIQLYCTCGDVVTDRLVGLDIAGEGTDRLVATFVTRDRYKVLTSRRVLTLTYDPAAGSYIYDFDGELLFDSPEFFNGAAITVEFSDPWFVGCPGPAVAFPGMWQKRYQHFIYEAADGETSIIPINHYITSHKGGIKLEGDTEFSTARVPDFSELQKNGIWLEDGGMFLTAYEPDGNPAIQFIGETARKSSISICWWGYDFHLSRLIVPDELFAPVPIHFRIFQCPDEKVQELLKRGKMPALEPGECGGREEYPVYERISSFDKGLRLDESYPGEVDPFPWEFKGTGAFWDKTYGRTDSFSLKIDRGEEGLTRWQTLQGDGEGFFAEPWTPCSGYRVSCWVKTDGVTGRGSTLAVQYYVPHPPQAHPVYTAKRLTGSHDWTKLEIEMGPPAPYPPVTGVLMIMLQQDGGGTTWFDDLEVQPIR